MNFDQAMNLLHATPGNLSQAERESLDHDGYVLFPRLMEESWLEELRAAVQALYREQANRPRQAFEDHGGDRRLVDLVNGGPAFDRVWTHPKVLAAVWHILQRPFHLSSLNARDALPGEGAQALHADWGDAPPPHGPFHVVNSLWMLDDFVVDNGATRVVPGSHRWGQSPAQAGIDAHAEHPEQQLITAPAGSVAVFNSHLWHGGTRNTSGQQRRACHCYYAAREHDQQTDQQAALRSETGARLSDAALYILNANQGGLPRGSA